MIYTYDLINYVKPEMRKKLKALVIHIDTNDIQKEMDTMRMVKKVIRVK